MSESGPLDPDRKQSLINKCLNERRRRDQENHYFEELAEIISASITDMSNSFSVKPEKCAILQETVKQIKQIKQGGSGEGDSAVQQSQVSSSKPTFHAEDVLGPLLLEALDGFMFVVNSQGKVEFVSDNITQFLKYTQDDLIGKSVYNIIHVGDHAQFANNLLPMSVGGSIGPWQADNQSGKGRVFNCRLLIKPPCNDNEDLETKQTYIYQYESMQISSILYPSDNIHSESSENTDASSSLVCIARRLPLAEKTNTMLGVEQFTTKQDLNGKIIGCDISGIAPGRFNCPDFVGQNIHEFCHSNDIQQLSRHLQDAIKNGSNTSAVYRFKMQENRYVFVQTKSKLFQHPASGTSEFIMSTHSVIRECDQDSEKGSASTSLMKSIIGPSLVQSQNRANPPISSVNTSMANMAIVSVPGIGSGSFLNLSDNVNEQDFLSQIGSWDSPSMADSSVSSTGNINLSGGTNSTVTTTSSAWMSSLRMSQVQQLQRSLSTQPTTRTGATGMMNNNNNKRAGNMMQYGQKSNSIDLGMQGQMSMQSASGNLGQMQQQISQVTQMVSQQGQKSPGYAHSPGAASLRNGNFQFPGQRGMMGGYNRRSPAASPIQGSFNAPFPPRTPSPMLSPSPGLSQNTWGGGQGGQPMASPTYTGNHSNSHGPIMDSSMVASANHLLQQFSSTGYDSSGADKNKNKRTGKLSQLLQQTNSPSSSHKSEPSTPKGGRSRHSSRQSGIMEMSPADSIQSPQPGPGQSPPEKPQSTSNDDGDHLVQTENKESNRLLKSLLSQNDDADDDVAKDSDAGNGSKSDQQSGEAQATVSKQSSSLEMEKNEAEAKKPNNILLKQLLSTEDELLTKNSIMMQVSDNSVIIQDILSSEKKQCRSVPAESTSIDSELARNRHQSGPQEPQSTTPHLQSVPPLSSPLPVPTPQNITTHNTPVLQEMFPMTNIVSTSAKSVSNSETSLSSASTGRSSDLNRSNFSMIDYNFSNITKNKKLDNLFNVLWEESNDDGTKVMKEKVKPSLKRKASSMDVKGSIDGDASSENIAENSDANASKLSKDNALLTKLLATKTSTDIVVNTLSTIQPSGIPQPRLPASLGNKVLKVNPSFVTSSSSTTDVKRPRIESSTAGAISTLESVLRMPKKDLNTSVSSSTPFDIDTGNNSNSGISNISDASVSSQLTELQQILQQTANSGNGPPNVMEVTLDDTTDPLLAQILQQAQDLQQEISTGFTNMNQCSSQSLSLESGNTITSAQSSQNTSLLTPSLNNIEMNSMFGNSMDIDSHNSPGASDIFQMLESAGDSAINISDIQLIQEQLAIEEIQKKLMTDTDSTNLGADLNLNLPINSGSMQNQQQQQHQQQQHQSGLMLQQQQQQQQQQNSMGAARFTQQLLGQGPMARGQNQHGQATQGQMNDQLMGNLNPGVASTMGTSRSVGGTIGMGPGGLRGQYVSGTGMSGGMTNITNMSGPMTSMSNMTVGAQGGAMRPGSMGGVAGANPRGMQPLPGYTPPPAGQNFPGATGPRLSHPTQGALPSPTQPQRPPMFNNPNSTAVQVRQSLLQQQKMKQIRERDKMRTQDRQKLLQLQQQQRSFNQQFPGQRFPHDSLNMGGQQGVMPFPENLADLMNSGTAPNVTLQRSSIPGPMSPRFGGLPPPQGSPGKMGPGGPPPPPQVSPNFNQPHPQGQWPNSNMGISPQNTNQFNNRHRSLSGGTLQTSPPQQRFPFIDVAGNQLSGGAGKQGLGDGMFPGQQPPRPNMSSQLQRQLSMPGRGSPRASQSPFGGPNPDPLMISPQQHNVSPNSMRPQHVTQISPSYSQGALNGASYAPSMTSNTLTSMTSPPYSQQGHMGDLDLNLFDNSRKPLDAPLSVNTPGPSQFIKQELRNICNARSQNSIGSGMMMQSPSPQYMVSQTGSLSNLQQSLMNQQQQQQQQLPHISMAQQQQLHTSASGSALEESSELPLDILEQINEMTEEHGINDYKEEVIVPKKREEAKNRYEKFQALATAETPDSKASSLFRKQLTLQPNQRSNSDDSGIAMLPDPGHSVNIVQNEPRTPIAEIRPANQKDSLLQQLLSD